MSSERRLDNEAERLRLVHQLLHGPAPPPVQVSSTQGGWGVGGGGGAAA
jgi:hypothetical protein